MFNLRPAESSREFLQIDGKGMILLDRGPSSLGTPTRQSMLKHIEIPGTLVLCSHRKPQIHAYNTFYGYLFVLQDIIKTLSR